MILDVIGEGFLPGALLDTECFGGDVVQGGGRRRGGSPWIIFEQDAVVGDVGQVILFEDFVGKFPAGASAAVAQMVDAVLVGFDEFGDGLCQVGDVSGVGDFVGDDADFAGLVGAVEDGMDEVVPARGEEPGEAHDVEAAEVIAHVNFGGGFRTAVGIDGVERHPFFIAFGTGAAKHFVGADVEQFAACFLGGEGYVLGAEAVDFVGEFGIFGTAIDVGHGGAVDDEMGLVGGNGRFH